MRKIKHIYSNEDLIRDLSQMPPEALMFIKIKVACSV